MLGKEKLFVFPQFCGYNLICLMLFHALKKLHFYYYPQVTKFSDLFTNPYLQSKKKLFSFFNDFVLRKNFFLLMSSIYSVIQSGFVSLKSFKIK